MALLAEQVPEHDREFVRLVVEAQLLGALDECILGLADRRNARQVALDVGGEDRNARAREAFGEYLQGDGLAGAGRAGHQAVAVAIAQRQVLGLAALADAADADENFSVLFEIGHQCAPVPVECAQRTRDDTLVPL